MMTYLMTPAAPSKYCVEIHNGGDDMVRRGFVGWLVSLRRRFFGWITAPRGAALLLGVLGIVVGYGGYLYRYCDCQGWPNLVAGSEQLFLDFYANIAASLVTITIAALTIDWLGERRAEKQLKAQLIREMGSSDNGIALRAVAELRAHGWIEDGSLRGAYLFQANLQSAELRLADLQGANLHAADLRKANLYSADLRGADLLDVDLRGAYLIKAKLKDVKYLMNGQLLTVACLRGAVLPDGRQYVGELSLPLDLTEARTKEVDTDDPNAMAHWYGVPLEDYLRGQEWARESLARVRREAGLEQAETVETVTVPQPEEWQSATPISSAPSWPIVPAQSLLLFTVRRLIELFWRFR